MSATQFESIVERLQRSANVRTVYGEPIDAGEKTVVPVARVAFGFGGGFGQSHGIGTTGGRGDDEPVGDHKSVGDREFGGDSEGGGLGGGSVATPVGAIEITEDQTRFVRFGGGRRSLGLLVVGLLAGLLVGRRTNQNRRANQDRKVNRDRRATQGRKSGRDRESNRK